MHRIVSTTAVLAAALTLIAAPAQAAAIAPPDDIGGSSLLPCGPHPTYGGYFCDLNDIAGTLSGVLDGVLNLTCLNRETNFIICRNQSQAPDARYNPGAVRTGL
ncbi:hypothetical protein [Nonomuraea ceibae]|uniref:hypothetical protein n=1 Tax=Nonomuraea ceibae TaxID=1935170 RepID=UPI001C5CF74F|nr:hypothetical protein [Nonomuraea ceibae]